MQGNLTKNCSPAGGKRKAGEGTRTLDIQLGKLALYQLSYARTCRLQPEACGRRILRAAAGCCKFPASCAAASRPEAAAQKNTTATPSIKTTQNRLLSSNHTRHLK